MTDIDLPALDLAPCPNRPRLPSQVHQSDLSLPTPTHPQLPALRGGGPPAAAPQERVAVSVEVDCFHDLTLFRGVVSGIGSNSIYLLTRRRATAGEILRIALPCPGCRRRDRLLLTCRIRTVEAPTYVGPKGLTLDVLKVEGESEPELYRRYLRSLGVAQMATAQP